MKRKDLEEAYNKCNVCIDLPTLDTATSTTIKRNGKDITLTICMEELAELSQRLSKIIRGKIDSDDITVLEEVADVELSLAMICKICNFSTKDVNRMMEVKAERIINNGV
jgi:NTP pyrophosphatase (non-canonical NTP hydrolase)